MKILRVPVRMAVFSANSLTSRQILFLDITLTDGSVYAREDFLEIPIGVDAKADGTYLEIEKHLFGPDHLKIIVSSEEMKSQWEARLKAAMAPRNALPEFEPSRS